MDSTTFAQQSEDFEEEQEKGGFEQNQEKCSEQSTKGQKVIFVTSQNKYSLHAYEGIAKFCSQVLGQG